MASFVGLVRLVMQASLGHIHLAPENRLEPQHLFIMRYLSLHLGPHPFGLSGRSLVKFLTGIGYLALVFPFKLADIVGKFLYAEHVAMVSQGKARHTEGHSLVDKARDRCLPVKQRILAMDV